MVELMIIPGDDRNEETNNNNSSGVVDLEVCLLPRFSESETSTSANDTHPFELPHPRKSRLQTQAAWTTQGEFRKEEISRRKTNGDQERERIMISHCWRDAATQRKKRRIISHLSKPAEEGGGGLAYWADYLDLQAEGPVPWRREIEEGIRACSKFVAFVDRAYLTSFNCLQEVALACMFGKPLVVIVLTEDAWNLLTIPGGAGQAKAEADAAARATEAAAPPSVRLEAAVDRDGVSSKVASPLVAWQSFDYGPPLYKYEGCDIVSGEPMSIEVVRKLFARLSAVNMCPCRSLEEENSGWDSMLEMSLSYVAKDIVYDKEHAQLMNKADAWQSAVRRNTPQPLLQEAEAASWSEWVVRADKYSLEPRPTDAMKAFVKASLRYSSRRRRTLRLLAMGFIVMLVAGVAASSVLAVEAERQAQEAQDLKALAEMRAREAEAAEARAIDSSRQATALLGKDFITSGVTYANGVRLKVLREMLARLPSNSSASVNATILAAGNALLQLPHAYTEQIIKGDKGGIGSVAWSHDGRSLAVLSSDSSALQVFEVRAHMVTSSPTQDLNVQGCTPTSLAWAPDRPLLAHACGGTPDNATALMLWSRGLDGRMELVQKVPGHNGTILSVAWSPDGRLLASGSADSTLRIWPCGQIGGEEEKKSDVFPTLLLNVSGSIVLEGHGMAVNGLAWSPDSRHVASASADSTLRIWPIMREADSLPDLKAEPQVLRGQGGGYVLSVAWSSSNKLASAHSFDNSVRLWTVGEDGTFGPEPTQVRNHGQSYRVVSLAWSLDGKSLAAASDGFTVRIWPALGEVGTLVSPVASLRGHSGRCTDIAWSPHGNRLVSSSVDGTLRVWAAGGAGTASPRVIKGASDVAWSPDGRIIAAPIFSDVHFWDEHQAAKDGAVRSNGLPQHALFSLGQSHTSTVKMVSWSMDGYHLATASDSTVRIWDVIRGTTTTASDPSLSASLQLLHGHNTTLHSVSFSPDGLYLASASDDSVQIWALENGNWQQSEPPQVFLAPGTRFRCLAWSPDGRHIASGTGDAMVRIWKAPKKNRTGGSPSFSLQVVLQAVTTTNTSSGSSSLGSINSLTWSPDGYLASASLDTTVRVWRFSEAKVPEESVPPSQVLEGQSKLGLCSLASTPGRLAFASGDLAAVQVWDVRDNGTVDTASLRSLEGHSQPASSVAFSPDGRRLASAARDFTVRIWDVFDIAGMRRKVEDIRFFDWNLTESDLAQPGFPKLLLDFPAQPFPA